MASPNLSEIVTTTLNNYSGKLADNVLNHNPLLDRLNRKGNVTPCSGGVKILQELEYAENQTAKWYSGYEALDVSASDVLTAAEFEWKQFNVNVTISGLEQMQNADSKERVHNLLRSRIRVAEKTAQNTVATSIFSDGTGTGGKEIGGLQLLVSDTPASDTVGGIAVTNTFWRNQVYDFSDENVTASSSTIQTAMNATWLNTIRGADKPDIIPAGKTYFEYYWSSLQANQRFTSADEGQAGFMSLKFMDADVFYDSNCADTRMYFLNTDYIFFRPHSQRNFKPLPERMSVNQDAIVVPMVWMGNMTVSNRSLQGVITA
jgi:hypothetical protein